MPQRPPRRPRLVIFDLDGVVYRGLDPVPSAAELINELHRRRIRVRYATNNSMASREAYVERLGAMGIRAAVSEMVTSTSATIGYLSHHLPEARHILAVGSPAMIAELRAAGLEVTPVADLVRPDYQGEALRHRVDAVVVGLDQAYDYLRIAVAAAPCERGRPSWPPMRTCATRRPGAFCRAPAPLWRPSGQHQGTSSPSWLASRNR